MKSNSAAGNSANPGSTDEVLVEGIRARDEQTWRQFVEEYSPAIYLWCRRCDLQAADARDVSQQVLYAVNRSIGKFSKAGGGSFRGWLFTITRNQIRNYLTRTLRGPRPEGGTTIQLRLLQEPESIDEESLSVAPSAMQPSPIQLVLDSVRKEFDERSWQCFWLITIEGKKAVEVGERLGMNAAAVRQAKYRVTKRLRRELGDFP